MPYHAPGPPNDPPNMAKKTKKKSGKKNPKIVPTASPSSTPPPPPPKTKYVPPQPTRSYRDPPTPDFDDMSESDTHSLHNVSASESNASLGHRPSPHQYQLSSLPSAETGNPKGPQPMETDDTNDTNDHHAIKRKRADTNPKETSTPSSTRSFSYHHTQQNQLGISFPNHSHASTNNSPFQGQQLPSLPLGSHISTAILNSSAFSSTPRDPPYDQHTEPTTQEHAKRAPERIDNLAVTGFLGDNPLTGLDPIIISTWKEINDLKALIYPHDASYSEDDKGQIAEKMELAIAHHLNCHCPLVTTPKAVKNYESRKTENRRPWCYLVTKLSEENLDTIIKDKFISNHYATLHVLPFSPHPSHYIGRIRNLTYSEREQKTVIALIQKTLDESSTVKNFIDEFTASHHDLIPHSISRRGKSREYIIKSARAFFIESGGIASKANYQWNWYILTPTTTPEHIETWTKFFADLIFNAGVHSVGDTVTTLKCLRCKSTNHTGVECPFTKRSDHIKPTPSVRATLAPYPTDSVLH